MPVSQTLFALHLVVSEPLCTAVLWCCKGGLPRSKCGNSAEKQVPGVHAGPCDAHIAGAAWLRKEFIAWCGKLTLLKNFWGPGARIQVPGPRCTQLGPERPLHQSRGTHHILALVASKPLRRLCTPKLSASAVAVVTPRPIAARSHRAIQCSPPMQPCSQASQPGPSTSPWQQPDQHTGCELCQ